MAIATKRANGVPSSQSLTRGGFYSRFLALPLRKSVSASPSSFLSHRLFDDYHAIVTAACNAWNRLPLRVGMTREYALIDSRAIAVGFTRLSDHC
jgi:hypothetical protein